jgi:hypothetical protein
MTKSLQYALYKGMSGKWGSIQFNLQPPHFYKGKEKDYTGSQALKDGKLVEGWDQREGCIFLDAASTKAPNVYDWENKVVLALSVNDMGKLLFTLATGEPCNIMHDPGAKSENQGQVKKFLNVTSPQGLKSGVMFQVTQSQGDTKKSHSIPVSADEVMVLRSLLTAAISRSLGW